MVSAAAFILLLLLPAAHADVGVEFECTIQAASGFDCNLLKQKFFKDNAISFIKEKDPAKTYAQNLKVTIGRLPVMNGYTFQSVVTETGKPNPKTFSSSTFVSDQANATSVIEEVNAVAQGDVLTFTKPVSVTDTMGKATVIYEDPSHTPIDEGTILQSGGKSKKWALTPSLVLSGSGASQVPVTGNETGSLSFTYSGDRNRFNFFASAGLAQTSVDVTNGNSQKLVGVNSGSAAGNASAIFGLDKANHFNAGVLGSVGTAPNTNVDIYSGLGAGIEYNVHPFLTADSNTLAVGCNIGPGYDRLGAPNVLNQSQVIALNESCAVSASLLLNKQRGTSLTGSVSQTDILNHPAFASLGLTVGANLRITDRLTISPSANIAWQTRSITVSNPNAPPSLAGLSPQQIAEEEVKYSTQAALGSSWSYGANLSISYTFGDGINITSQDQRGIAIR